MPWEQPKKWQKDQKKKKDSVPSARIRDKTGTVISAPAIQHCNKVLPSATRQENEIEEIQIEKK